MSDSVGYINATLPSADEAAAMAWLGRTVRWKDRLDELERRPRRSATVLPSAPAVEPGPGRVA